ncbi:glycosyltransferase family protein [Salinimicrobium catena]|uniref:UDP-glycosyltransferase n=1 Tax=Salinimicrobium catena TaxID=390640 RepID=UPI001FDF1946|nr:UDP-glycosyltransferase [Salinimicrobium catena]
MESINVDDSSGAKGRVALIKNLQRAGYELVVYHYSQKDIHLEGIRCIAIRENRKSLMFFLSRLERQLRHKLNVDLHKPLEERFGFSFTLFNDRNSILDTLRSSKEFNPDLILTLSQGGRFRPHHALLKIPEWHHKWIAYMHDPYPMHHYPKPFTWYEPGYAKKENFVKQISERAEFSAFPSLLLKEWMTRFYPNFSKTGIIIPHQIDPVPEKEINFPEYFNPAHFNLLHAGNLLGARNPKGLVKAFEEFLKKNPGAKGVAKLLFLGGHNKRVEKIARENENVYSSRSYISFKQVYQMQQAAAVNIILEAKADISPFLPGKFPHCVGAEKPILLLGPAKSEARRLLGYNYPYWAEIDEEEKISGLIENLYSKWKKSPNTFVLNRPDLQRYMSEEYLQEVLKLEHS